MDRITRDRVIELCRQIWSSLTEEEHKRIFSTFSFVENIIDLLDIDDFDWNVETLNSIHHEVFGQYID